MNSAVTREDIHAAVMQAFVTPPVTQADLITVAMASGARPDVLRAMEELPPESRFHHIRDIWEFLPDVIIERTP